MNPIVLRNLPVDGAIVYHIKYVHSGVVLTSSALSELMG